MNADKAIRLNITVPGNVLAGLDAAAAELGVSLNRSSIAAEAFRVETRRLAGLLQKCKTPRFCTFCGNNRLVVESETFATFSGVCICQVCADKARSEHLIRRSLMRNNKRTRPGDGK